MNKDQILAEIEAIRTQINNLVKKRDNIEIDPASQVLKEVDWVADLDVEATKEYQDLQALIDDLINELDDLEIDLEDLEEDDE